MTEELESNWHETLIGEVMLLSLLSRIIYNYPDNEERAWLQSLIDEDIFSESPFAFERDKTKIGLSLLQNWSKNGLSDEVFEQIQGDYSRLFIGPGKVIAPPWESVYFGDEKLLFQEKTIEVRKWYLRFGLEAEKIHQEPDDHIGLELLFLSHLARLGIQALEEETDTQFKELLEAQQQFLEDHLGKWALKWCYLLDENAKTNFYKGVAHLTSGAISELKEVLNMKSTKVT